MAGLRKIKYWSLSFYYFILIFYLVSCNNYDNSSRQELETGVVKTARITFYDPEGKKNIEIVAELAETEYMQSKGLMFREDMPENSGMMFIYNDERIRTFWMKNTPLPLDIIFLNKDLKIIKIHARTTPYSQQLYSSGNPAQFVLEVNGGFCERYGIYEDHSVIWEMN